MLLSIQLLQETNTHHVQSIINISCFISIGEESHFDERMVRTIIMLFRASKKGCHAAIFSMQPRDSSQQVVFGYMSGNRFPTKLSAILNRYRLND